MSKITIARALVELKSLKGRIERAGSTPVVGIIVGEGEHARPVDNTFTSKDTMATTLQGNFDSIVALMKRREAIKRAIVKGNASTIVKIGGKDYTLAEAIEMKTFVGSRKAFLQNLSRQLRSASSTVSSLQKQLEERVDSRRSEMGEAGEEVLSAAINDIRSRHTPSMLAHTDLQTYINSQMAEIEDFEQEVDVTLNEVNAATLIDVEE